MTMPDEIKLPDPVVAAQWTGVARHVLTYGGGMLSGLGFVMPSWLGGLTDPQLNVIISGIMFFSGLGMFGVIRSKIDKWRNRQEMVATAMLSARQGEPLVVTVTPPGQPNTVASVSGKEQAEAPTVPANAPIEQPSPAS